jgi:DNA-binding CsgD family transcriptional regulator
MNPGTPIERHVRVELAGTDIVVTGDPAAVAALLDRLRPPRTPALAGLTGQEAAVAALVGEALTDRQIARRLRITPHTVNFHLRQIYRKLAISSRVHLAMLARADHEGRDGSH